MWRRKTFWDQILTVTGIPMPELIVVGGDRLRNDLYCVEWDVKLYYTYTCWRGPEWSCWYQCVTEFKVDMALEWMVRDYWDSVMQWN